MDIRVPQLAEGSESGTVVNILVKVGDRVEKEQTIVELESAKAVGSLPATEAGTVSRIYVTSGQEVKIGQPLIAIDSPSGGPAPTDQLAESPSAARGAEQ